MNVSDIMTTSVVTCNVDESLQEVARKMQKQNIGLCPVFDENQLVGVVTDRDITVRAVAQGLDLSETTASSIMSPNPATGNPNMSVEDACLLMSDKQIRRLPIMESDRLVGIISLADLAMDVEEEEMVAETLEKISEPAHI